MHISSLPADYGIGDMGRRAYEFADFLHAAGQSYWQVLPLGPTSYVNSPYQSPSAFAGNPYFIDLEDLCAEGLLTKGELNSARMPAGEIDYGALFATRMPLLRKAFARFKPSAEYKEFCERNKDWLEPYALFCALKERFELKPHWEWQSEYRDYNSAEVKKFAADNAEQTEFICFTQYLFHTQWKRLKAYVNSKGIKIIGDAPIYAAYDSADFWRFPNMFAVNGQGEPSEVAGVPPDYFSADGQLWGNPLYNWQYLSEHGYDFWVKRVTRALELCDLLRIDHFRGFCAYYCVPAGANTAREGTWRTGPGKALFDALEFALGNPSIIAEDLGTYSPELGELLRACGYPGMKVVQFGFDGAAKQNAHAVCNFTENSIGYTGTHDNDTALGWYGSLNAHMRKRVRGRLPAGCGDIAKAMICALYGSKCKTAIVPVQDWLRQGSEARMNTPGVTCGNWRYRLQNIPPESLAEEMKQTALKYNRAK